MPRGKKIVACDECEKKNTILGSKKIRYWAVKKYAGKEKNNEKESQWLTIFNVHIQV